ncbi:MAG: endolytic transglycosylase MltG [Acidobacteria bacterium]|nr:MAG: endolytic transglycosylase MltG [Acidobacteriota bacterium]
MRRIFTFLTLAVLFVAGWAAWALLMPLNPREQKFVLLRPGYSTRRIAVELKSAGVIRNPSAFVLWHYFHHNRSLKAGEYLFETTASARTVHDRLARGDIYVHTVVIPEGYTIFDIAQAMQDAGLATPQEFLNAAQSNTSLISDLAPEAKSLEGFLFPETYQFTRTQTLQEMIAAMVKQFRQVAAEIGLNSDVQRIVTLASIIEKETGAAEERPLVASVYQNRLAKNIALQADPSVIYAEQLEGTYGGALHHADMRFNSSYNTYTHPGLPPGPIGNPGRSSLEAAMHPAKTDYYYFVSNGNGHHRFAQTLEEHNRNVAALRKIVQKH